VRLVTSQDRNRELSDHIWSLLDNNRETCDHITNALKEMGLPFFDKYSNYQQLIDLYETNPNKMLGTLGVGKWDILLAALSYERLGKIQESNKLYKIIATDHKYAILGEGTLDFVRNKLKE
jgi:hypothetical protein